jgi:TonB family protein
MKNINSRILLIALFQFSFSAFSQDSLAMKSYDINSEPPTPTPFVNNNESDFKIHSILESRPELTQDSKNKMIEFLDKAYSGKGDKTSGEVTIKFVCTKEGTAHSMTINKEKPKDMGFGNAVIEAMKLAKFIPAKESGDKTVNVRMSLQFYFYNRKENRIEIK